MKPTPQSVQRLYLTLTLFSTLATSFIWGINTLFLLDAGLSNAQAFLANAFFTVGQVLFEVPTGVVADTKGRRTSYLLGTVTLAVSTLAYLGAWQIQAPFWIWAISSMLLGLGFTFFSGATEAWIVDALEFSNYKGKLESVFAKGQMVSGVAMLSGSVAGGFIAQVTDLSVPYILRAIILGITFIIALVFMKDWGFEAEKGKNPLKEMKTIFGNSINFGLKNPSVRWVMLAAPFTGGVGFYTFYAMQPFLLELYGDESAYGIAGLAAAIVALAQVIGGVCVPFISKLFKRRTSVLLTGAALNVVLLLVIGVANSFWIVLAMISVWALVFAASMPVRQAYMNGLIPSKQRATVLSFDSLMSSTGGSVIQPGLGRVADAYNYPTSFLVGAAIQSLSLPFVYLARLQKPESDEIKD